MLFRSCVGGPAVLDLVLVVMATNTFMATGKCYGSTSCGIFNPSNPKIRCDSQPDYNPFIKCFFSPSSTAKPSGLSGLDVSCVVVVPKIEVGVGYADSRAGEEPANCCLFDSCRADGPSPFTSKVVCSTSVSQEGIEPFVDFAG